MLFGKLLYVGSLLLVLRYGLTGRTLGAVLAAVVAVVVLLFSEGEDKIALAL